MTMVQMFKGYVWWVTFEIDTHEITVHFHWNRKQVCDFEIEQLDS